MKKFTLLILSLVLSALAMAQPVLNQSMNFILGDTYQIDGYYDVPAIDVGSVGPDQEWDFSEIVGDMFIEGESSLCVDPSETPFADSAVVQMSDVAIKLLNSDEGPYLFFKNHGDKRELIAQGYYTNGSSSFGPWDPPMTDLKYPLAMGSVFDFNYEYMSWHIEEQFYNMRDSGHVHVEADAWGSITTPFGEFTNVLRVKSVITSHFWMGFDADDPMIYLGEFVDIHYNWYDPQIKVPVFTITEMSFKSNLKKSLSTILPGHLLQPNGIASPIAFIKDTGETFYTVQYVSMYGGQTSITPTLPVISIELYPNPASGIVNLKLPPGHRAYEATVTDLTGRKIFNCLVLDDKIDISDLMSGLYILQVTTLEGMKADYKMMVR